MKRYLSFFLVLSCFTTSNYAVLVKLADAQTLRNRLGRHGFDYFISKTDIIDRLANQEYEAVGVSVIVYNAFYNYGEYTKKRSEPHVAHDLISIMHKLIPSLIKLILQEHPEAFAELEREGFIL